MCWLSKLLKPKLTVDVSSPRDLIPQSDIKYDSDTRRLTVDNLPPDIWLTTVADTNSMDPTIDVRHTTVLTNHISYENLAVGDVVVYNVGGGDIIHRIIKMETDNQGRKYTAKGDNNSYADPYILRDTHIKWLLLAIFY